MVEIRKERRLAGRSRRRLAFTAVVFLGEDLLAYLVLALGAALALGNVLALLRPPPERAAGDLERAPVGRSLAMAALGAVAAIWALASLVSS